MTPSSGEEEGLHGGEAPINTNSTTQEDGGQPPIIINQGLNSTSCNTQEQEEQLNEQLSERLVDNHREELCEREEEAGGAGQGCDTLEEGVNKEQHQEGSQQKFRHAAASSPKHTPSTHPLPNATYQTEHSPSTDSETETETGTWPPTLKVRRTGEALDAFLQATNADVSAETMRGVTPSFTEALEWVTSRSSDLNGALRLVHLYPNLIQAACLDGLWDFLMPFVQRGTGLRVATLEEQHLAMHGRSEQSAAATRRRRDTGAGGGHLGNRKAGSSRDHGTANTSDKRNQPKLVYVSCDKSNKADLTGESDTLDASAIERLIMALSSHCFVQCSPSTMPPVSSPSTPQGGWTQAIHHAQIMVFLMDKHTLYSDICMRELEEALRHSTPVVMVKAKDFELPDTFPVRVQNVRIPRPDSGRKRQPTVTVSSIRAPLVSKADDFCLPQLEIDSPIADDNVKRLFSLSHTGITLRKSSTEEDCSEATLEDHIRKLMPKAIEYTASSHDSCFEELHRRLESYIGKGIPPGGAISSKDTEPEFNAKETHLLLNVGCILPNKRLPDGNESSLGVRPRAYSVRSAPEYRLPTPPSRPKQLQNQDPKAQSQNTTINGYTLLPPIDPMVGGPLRKHRSQELPPPSPRLEFNTDRRTNYLILRKPGSGAELVPWPPEERKEEGEHTSDSLGEDGPLSRNDSEELFGLRCDSDSDSSFTVALSSIDINTASLSPTPDFV